jgi:hypothetical protein
LRAASPRRISIVWLRPDHVKLGQPHASVGSGFALIEPVD